MYCLYSYPLVYGSGIKELKAIDFYLSIYTTL